MYQLSKSALRWALVFGLLAAAFWGTWSLFAPIPTVSEINIAAESWKISIPVWPMTRLWDIPGLALWAAGLALSFWLGDLSDRRDIKWVGNVAIFALLIIETLGLLIGSFSGFMYGLIIGLLIGIAIWLTVAFGIYAWRMVTSKFWVRLWRWMNADQMTTTT